MTFPLAEDDEEFTELVDAKFGRVDLVQTPATGARFVIAKGEDSRGLVPPEVIRDLIGKSEPEPEVEVEGPVTVSGSPAAMAAFIHKAAERADVEKAKNDTADRKHKAATGAAMSNGSYPIANEADLTKAIHAVGRGGSSHNAIRKHIISRARSLGASSKIPDNWNSDGSLKGDSVSKTAPAEVGSPAAYVGASTRTGRGDLVTKADTDLGPELDDDADSDDGMDLTVPLAAPDDDAPGDATDPGSPAWENIDAATAQKWTSIAVRLKNALCIMADRELVEAATADPGDAENAFDLQDAMCAVDFVIDTLASFAVGEQAESDFGGEALDAIGKAMATFDPAEADALEGLTAIRKSGRVLSSANEQRIRDAAASLQSVLASLPAAPQATDSGLVVAKEKETAVADTSTQAAPDKVRASLSPGETVLTPEMVAKAEETAVAPNVARGDAGLPPLPAEPAVVTKADAPPPKASMQAVFDQNGNLVGIVDPTDINPVSGAGTDASDDGGAAAPEPEAAAPAPAADPSDLAPAPAADAGTPADAPADDDKPPVAKAEDTTATDQQDFAAAVAKSVADTLTSAFENQSATLKETIAKQAEVIDGQAAELEAVKKRVEEIAEQPAAPKVFTNGAVPPPGQLRGQDQGSQPVDVAKAQELKRTLYTGTAPEQNKAFADMQQMAIDQLAGIHAAPRR